MTNDPVAYLNGQFVPRCRLMIDAADAGFVYGATVTDFCRTYNQKLFRWPEHLRRFRRDCEACCIPLLESDSELTEIAQELLERNPANGQERAILTFATPGPLLGRSTSSDSRPTLGMQTLPIEASRYQRFFDTGVSLEQSPIVIPKFLTHVKHRSRLHWWIAQTATSRPDVVAILGGEEGHGLDSAIGSVFMVDQRGELLVPKLDRVLDSISMRVVTELCHSLKIQTVECEFDHYHLVMATEIMLAGSGFGLAGVSSLCIESRTHEYDWPGPVTLRLQRAWSERVGCDITKIPDPS